MKTKLLLLALALYSCVAFCTTVTIVNSGYAFSPATITIIPGDSVLFSLASIHNAVEVSQATWNASGSTSLPGGFSTPAGGGLVLPAQLTVGTHWYVCQPHVALMGMKGIIIVQNFTGITENPLQKNFSVYPNPATSQVTLNFGKEIHGTLKFCNTLGEILEQTEINSALLLLDISNKPKGIYFITVTPYASGKTENKAVRKVVKM